MGLFARAKTNAPNSAIRIVVATKAQKTLLNAIRASRMFIRIGPPLNDEVVAKPSNIEPFEGPADARIVWLKPSAQYP